MKKGLTIHGHHLLIQELIKEAERAVNQIMMLYHTQKCGQTEGSKPYSEPCQLVKKYTAEGLSPTNRNT